jgi:hypothetical protein
MVMEKESIQLHFNYKKKNKMEKEIIAQSNQIPEKLKIAMLQANTAMNKINVVGGCFDKIGDVVIQVKEIDYAIKQMDSHVEIMLMEYDFKIEKFKLILPLMQKQLSNFSDNTNTILSEILKMDANSNEVNYIAYRSELISTLRGTSERLSDMFIKFISI